MSVYGAWSSGKTKRKHTMQTLFDETTAEHTWGMCMLLVRYVPSYRPHMMTAVIQHDMGEAATADIPAHVCWAMPELKAAVEVKEREHIRQCMTTQANPSPQLPALTADEALMLEVLDRAEFILSCWREVQMGNTLTLRPIHRAWGKVEETLSAMTSGSTLRAAAAALGADLLRDVKPLTQGVE